LGKSKQFSERSQVFFKNLSTTEPSFDRMEESNQNEMSIKISGNSILNFKRPKLLAEELERCKPKAVITNAFINKDNLLIIKTKSTKTIKQLNEPWPSDAFETGIEIITKKTHYVAAINNVDTEIDIADEETLSQLKSTYNIIKATRLVKKSQNNRPLKTIKITTNNEESFKKLLTEGLYIWKTRFSVKPWIFEDGPIQCSNCQKFGHKFRNCRNKERCQLCSEEGHNHKTCQSEKIICCNCNEQHAASSKKCPTRITKKGDSSKIRKQNLNANSISTKNIKTI